MGEQLCSDLHSMIRIACVRELNQQNTVQMWSFLLKANDAERIRNVLQNNPKLRLEFFEIFYSIFYLDPTERVNEICDFPIEGFFTDLDLSKISQEKFTWFQNFLWAMACKGRFQEILAVSQVFLK